MSTVTTTQSAPDTAPTLQAQAGILLGHVAGYMALRTVELGLRSGIIGAIETRPGCCSTIPRRVMSVGCFRWSGSRRCSAASTTA